MKYRCPSRRLRRREVAVGERGADPRAADAFVLEFQRTHAADAVAVPVAGSLQHGVVAHAPGAETEVVSNDDVFRAQPVAQEIPGHVRRRHGRHCLVERHAQQRDRCPSAGAGCIFSRNRVSRAGTSLPRKNSLGWGSNVINRLGRSSSAAFATSSRKQLLVPVVHAIEIADGHDIPAYGAGRCSSCRE